MTERPLKAVVIGAGMGGLAAATRLVLDGADVTLLEAGDRPGGKVSGHRWGDHTVDYAPHVFSMGKGGEVARIPQLLGEHQEFVDDSPLAKVVLGERRFPFPAKFRSLVDTARLVIGSGVKPWNWLGAGRHFLAMMRGGPDLRGEAGEISVREWTLRYTDDRAYHQIINMFSILAFVVTYDRASAQEMAASIHRMVTSSGVGYPVGGLYGMTRRMVRGLRRHGVDVRYGHRVERIESDGGRVRAVWANGQRFEADVVFSNAGIRGTAWLAGEDAVGPEYTAYAESLEDSLAGIMVRYALDREVIDSRVLFVMPDITGDEFAEAVHGDRMIELEPGYYVTVGSNFDPGLAPAGGQSIVCGTLYYPDADRDDESARMLERMEQRLFALYPELPDAIVERELVTTSGIGQVSGRGITGEAIGVAQTVEQSGANRPDFRTPVDGLFVVGADTGGRAIGTELAAKSGFEVAEYVLSRGTARWIADADPQTFAAAA